MKILIVWQVVNVSTVVYLLELVPSFLKLQGRYTILHRQGKPDLEDDELELLRTKLEAMQPLVHSNLETIGLLVGVIDELKIIVCGYDPSEFVYSEDYDAKDVIDDAAYDRMVEETMDRR